MYVTAREYLGLEIPKAKENYKSITIPKPEPTENTANPNVWGPPFWFSLHISAVYYPENPSPIVRERMKCRILAIPYEIPCALCRPHAISFIESHRENLDNIVSNRHELGAFYVDFHNKVNERYGKPTWTYEKAYKYYSGQI